MIRRSVSSCDSPGSARPDPAAGPREVGPQPGQPRQLVLELGQLHLEAALVGLRVLGEDVEDQPAPVDDLDLEQLLEGPLLAGRQLVVGDEDVEAGLALGGDELLGLALADVPVRVDVAAVLPLGADDLGAGGRGQAGQLGERILGGPAGVRRRCRRRRGTPSRRARTRSIIVLGIGRRIALRPGSTRPARVDGARSPAGGESVVGGVEPVDPGLGAGTRSAGAWRTRRCGRRRARSPPRA